MFTYRIAGIIGATALLLTPLAAPAQTCSSLRAQLNASGAEMAGIATDYPLTHFSIMACLANNERQDDAFACAASVVALACLSMGPDYCRDLTSRWARAGQNYWRIVARMRELGCAI